MPETSIDAILMRAPVIPVLTVERLEDAVPLARALVAGGLPVLEVTLRTPVAIEAIAAMAAVEGAIVGAGTVLDEADLEMVTAAGGRFAVSPGATPALLQAGRRSAIPFLPAIATASELMRAREAGLRHFKFFPAAAAGGPAVLRAFAGPFGGVRFCPTGGIAMDNLADYLSLPNVVCVGGSWMIPPEAVAGGQWDTIERLARAAQEAGSRSLTTSA